MYCQSLTHKDCISSQVADDNRFRCETCLMNDVRSMQPVESVDANILKLCVLDNKDSNAEPNDSPTFPCIICEETFKAETELTTHIEQMHTFSCEDCANVCTTEIELKTHANSTHDVRNQTTEPTDSPNFP